MKSKISGNPDFLRLLMISSILILFFVTFGQDNPPIDQDDRVSKLSPLGKELLAKRIEELTQKKMESCKMNAIKAAEIHVDSLIIREAAFSRAGIYGIPLKPSRPDVPNVLLKADSIDIGPLFDEDTLKNR